MSQPIGFCSQLLQRQLHLFKGRNLLIAGDLSDNYPVKIAQTADSVSCFVHNYQQYLQLSQAQEQVNNIQCQFGAEFNIKSSNVKSFDTLLIYWSKTKKEVSYLLAMLMPYLEHNGTVIIVGENNSGVRSAERLFESYGPLKKYDSARRCGLYVGLVNQIIKPFDIREWLAQIPFQVNDKRLTIYSLPGVFSYGAIDVATKLLLTKMIDKQCWVQAQNRPQEALLKVLDFGCGTGVIGASLLASFDHLSLHFCDVNALALASTRYTLLNNNLLTESEIDDCLFATSDQFQLNQVKLRPQSTDKTEILRQKISLEITSQYQSKYHTIVSNPPFHGTGRELDMSITERLLAQAPVYLANQGELWIVANHFLPYFELIQSKFGYSEVVERDPKFCIYLGRKV